MDELPYEERRIQRHTRWLLAAVDRWQDGPQTLAALGGLVSSAGELINELEADADPAWTDRLNEAWADLELIYAVRLDRGGDLDADERRDVARAANAIRELVSGDGEGRSAGTRAPSR